MYKLEPHNFLNGDWTLVNTIPKAMPVEGSDLSAEALADSLLNYTFLTENSTLTFSDDSIRLTTTVPLSLPYTYHRQVVTIRTPYDLPFLIQGYAEIAGDFMRFKLTPTSYLSILDYVQPPFRNQLLSADITYELQRKN
ncbi:MAG: hypothetical protein K2P54_01225 [Odoribacter sp.]|nr:hypothetical protein [Odoribacter sp.]